MGSCKSTPKINPSILKLQNNQQKKAQITNKDLDLSITKNLSIASQSPRKQEIGIQTSSRLIKNAIENTSKLEKKLNSTNSNNRTNSLSPLFSKRNVDKIKESNHEKLSKLDLDSSIHAHKTRQTIKVGNKSLNINRNVVKLKILNDSFNNSFNSSFNKSLTIKPKRMETNSKSGFLDENLKRGNTSVLSRVKPKENSQTLFNLYETLEENEDDENYDKIQDDVKMNIINTTIPLNNLNSPREEKKELNNFRRNSLINRHNFSKLNVSCIKETVEEIKEEDGENLSKVLENDENYDEIDALSNEVIPSDCDVEEIEHLLENKKKNKGESSFLDMVGRKDAILHSRDIIRANIGESDEEEEFSEVTSGSSGLLFEIPTPGASDSKNPFS